MKLRTKVLISLAVGLCAMLLYSLPMWWGVLFSPIAEQLTTAGLSSDMAGGFRWEAEGIVFRLKGLDLLLSFLHLS